MSTVAGERESVRKPHSGRVLISVFVAMFFIWGGTSNTIQIFLTPLMKQHGWSHARASALPTGYSLALGLCSPFVGLLIDRIDVCVVMASGATLAALGMVLLGCTASFWPTFSAYVVVGLGVAASVSVPAAVVAANWFGERRGVALGVTLSGSAMGGMLLPLIADYLIHRIGTGATYVVLGAAIFSLPLPLILLFIRTRPAGSSSTKTADAVKDLSGLELESAVREPQLWLLVAVQVLCSICIGGIFYQTVPALIHAGYQSRNAALAASSVMAVAIGGVMLMGMLSDRFTGRKVLPFLLIGLGTAPLLLLGSRGGSDWRIYLVAFVIVFALTTGVTTCVTPVVLAEILGLRRFGTLNGILSMAGMVATSVAPLIIGWVVDRTGSYGLGFTICAALCYMGAGVAFAISPAAGMEEVPVAALSTVQHH